MPFCETYMTAFKNDIEYSHLVLHTAAVLQSNKFMQVRNQTKDAFLKWNLGCIMGTKGLKTAGVCVLWVVVLSASPDQKE